MSAIRKALSLNPTKWGYWNTLGVAAYRAGDWKTADEALEKSMSLNEIQGGQAADWFFLAMTRWRQGQPAEARKWFDRAVEWTKKNQSGDPELLRFQAEAAASWGSPRSLKARSPSSRVDVNQTTGQSSTDLSFSMSWQPVRPVAGLRLGKPSTTFSSSCTKGLRPSGWHERNDSILVAIDQSIEKA